jgi:fructan beta-fructosidase
MNDPNGLVYYKGEYHLFYQHNPLDIVWGPMHWGHAVSTDLMHWEHLPIALYPDDMGAIFSGSVVVDWNDSSGFFNGGSGLVAVFTHHSREKEVQSIAYSLDSGRSWIKYKDNPVIDNPKKKDFRDPKVFFHHSFKKWVAVLSCGCSVSFYSSANLKQWEFKSEFAKDDDIFTGIWECPDLFQLGINGSDEDKKWVLKVDVNKGALAGGSGGAYYIGDFDGKTFRVDDPLGKPKWLDYSKDFYAAQTWDNTYHEQNRRIWIAWMNNWQYAHLIPALDFRSMMTLPRELELKKVSEELFLIQRPVREVRSLRKDGICEKNLAIKTNKSYQMDSSVKAIEILAEIKYDPSILFNIIISFGNNEGLLIDFDGKNNKIILDRSKSGETGFSEFFTGKFTADLVFVKEYIKLNIFVDINGIEIFINEGIICMTSLIFPKEHIKFIDICPVNGFAELKSLEIYKLYEK